MNATLSFDLDIYDDKLEHLKCVQAGEVLSALHEFIYNTRKGLKINAEEHNLDRFCAIDLVYEKFWEIMNERNIDIDKLTQ